MKNPLFPFESQIGSFKCDSNVLPGSFKCRSEYDYSDDVSEKKYQYCHKKEKDIPENKVRVNEYFLNPRYNQTNEKISARKKLEDKQVFMARYSKIFDEPSETYQIENLKDWFGEKVKPEVKFTNRGEMVISNLTFPVPDLANEYRDKYNKKIDNMKLEHRNLISSFCLPNKYLLWGPLVVTVLLAIAFIILILWIVFKRTNTPVP